tara:strand:- start:7734 stop:8651 length:918 start_codon:yes stop_codon:yes gene_type:complete
MSRNTLLADINEIMMAYYLSGGWSKIQNSEDAKAALKEKASQLTPQEVNDQKGRAKIMAEDALNWAASNGWTGDPSEIWWTARPNVLASAITAPPSPGNPTDVLAKFGDDFLGFSAKSTKSASNIGFKNPGAKPIASALGIDITGTVKDATLEVIENYILPPKQTTRKQYIRSLKTKKPEVFKDIEQAGYDLLKKLRDMLLERLKYMGDEDLREHIIDYWLDANAPYPYYIKVTGRGKNGNYSANISDPTKNEKYKALMADPIRVVPVGDTSVGIMAGNTKIMKMRYKYESQKMASSLKMSGDPW